MNAASDFSPPFLDRADGGFFVPTSSVATPFPFVGVVQKRKYDQLG